MSLKIASPEGPCGYAPCLSDIVHSGEVVGERKHGSRRFWTTREIKVLCETFPVGSLAACLPLLPGRTAGSIYQQARLQGLVSPAAQIAPRGPRWPQNDAIDTVIRRSYGIDTSKGAVMTLARNLGRPRWWVSKRAVALGLVPQRQKEPVWREDEIALLEKHAHRKPDAIARTLWGRGFRRTPTAVAVKLKRLGFDRSDPDHCTATQLATMMGVDAKTVLRWVDKCWLKAGRRGTGHERDHLWIHRRDVRRFVIENAAAVDIRKVDKTWFIDLLAGEGTFSC